MTTNTANQNLIARVRESLARIAAVRECDGRTLVDLPIMYPSGAMAVVEVVRSQDKYWVSDMGHGHLEAEFMAADFNYGRIAHKVAEEFGLDFDGNAIFALWVTDGRLEAAIICVANASNKACTEAIRQASEIQVKHQNERIFSRIVKVFGERFVSKSESIIGSHAKWEAHNVVVLPNERRAVFEFMSGHSNSVSNKFLMFTDIQKAHSDIALTAVVRSIADLDEKAQIVGDVANIVEISAADEIYRQYARAA